MAEPTDCSFDGARAERLAKLGREIKRARDDAALTQAQLGERLAAYLGEVVPQTTVSRWESGSVSLDFETVMAIEKALDLTLGALARAARYVVAADEERWPGFMTGFLSDIDDAIEHVKAADTLGIGVRVFNRVVPFPAYGADTETVEWVVELFHDTPRADD